MSDPVAEATERLSAAYVAVAHLAHPSGPPTGDPTFTEAEQVRMARLRRFARGPRRAPEPEARPPATEEQTAIRDGLYRAAYGADWYRHPVAQRIRGDSVWHVAVSRRWTTDRHYAITPDDLADLDALPALPAERAAVLAASAFTARQERDRHAANAEGALAREAKQHRETAATYADHYDRAVAMLSDAFGAWWPSVDAATAARPVVPAYPTVAATARPTVYTTRGLT